MRVTISKLTSIDLMHDACSATTGKPAKCSLNAIYKTEHSPMRTQIFWVAMVDIPTFVSVHFTRHKIGVEHFVKSMRDDIKGNDIIADRDTPVNHCMLINAQSLVNLARERLCYKAHRKTVALMRKIKNALRGVDDDLFKYLVPKCVYRNGICPEFSECKPGLKKVMGAYKQYQLEIL